MIGTGTSEIHEGKAFPCGRAEVSSDPFERGVPRNAPLRVRVRAGFRDGLRAGRELPAPVAENRDVQIQAQCRHQARPDQPL